MDRPPIVLQCTLPTSNKQQTQKETRIVHLYIKYIHINQYNTHHTHGLMLAITIPVKDLNLQRTVHVTVAQRGHGNLHRGPDGIQGIVNLGTLPHHRV